MGFAVQLVVPNGKVPPVDCSLEVSRAGVRLTRGDTGAEQLFQFSFKQIKGWSLPKPGRVLLQALRSEGKYGEITIQARGPNPNALVSLLIRSLALQAQEIVRTLNTTAQGLLQERKTTSAPTEAASAEVRRWRRLWAASHLIIGLNFSPPRGCPVADGQTCAQIRTGPGTAPTQRSRMSNLNQPPPPPAPTPSSTPSPGSGRDDDSRPKVGSVSAMRESLGRNPSVSSASSSSELEAAQRRIKELEMGQDTQKRLEQELAKMKEELKEKQQATSKLHSSTDICALAFCRKAWVAPLDEAWVAPLDESSGDQSESEAKRLASELAEQKNMESPVIGEWAARQLKLEAAEAKEKMEGLASKMKEAAEELDQTAAERDAQATQVLQLRASLEQEKEVAAQQRAAAEGERATTAQLQASVGNEHAKILQLIQDLEAEKVKSAQLQAQADAAKFQELQLQASLQAKNQAQEKLQLLLEDANQQVLAKQTSFHKEIEAAKSGSELAEAAALKWKKVALHAQQNEKELETEVQELTSALELATNTCLEDNLTTEAKLREQEETEKMLEQARREITALEQQTAEKEDHIKDLSMQLETTKQELQTAKQELQTANQELQTANQELKTANQESTEMAQALEAAEDERDQIEDNMVGETVRLKAELAEAQAGLERLQEEMKQESENQQAEVKQAQAQLEQAETALTEAQADGSSQDEISALQRELEAAKRQLKESEVEKTKKEAEVVRLKLELRDTSTLLDKAALQDKEHSQSLKEMHDELRAKNERQQELEAKLSMEQGQSQGVDDLQEALKTKESRERELEDMLAAERRVARE
eukprot:gene19179-22929_t